MVDEAAEVIVSLRSSGGLLEESDPKASRFQVLGLGEGGSVDVDVDAVRRCGEVGELCSSRPGLEMRDDILDVHVWGK